ncbi:conserved hypothetical protein [Candidatus Sulfopaludibacter sp. SbA4]|nr:conserved hypothetical protein [Candidatus Sulfopaludibacter sp. SbA4]
MKTFEQFVSESAEQGSVNLIFEAGMHSLVNDLESIVEALQHAGVQFEVVGGVAVNAHILALHRSRSFVTRDIDLLVNRSDLQQIAEAAEPLGYHAKKMMGGYTLIRPEQDLAEAVHLIFVGEKSKSTQPLPHPALHPEDKLLFGLTIPVAPLNDLLQMKLNSLRPKDLIHLETLDEVGLITPSVEQGLPAELRERLKEARERIAENKPDVEG